ncbi:MAG: RnfABCDGE type electron transport complex subunit D [Pseudomonadota bacterium]|nr:RnfABCDGE type electron transport complex subunit D [Pseudomonadota bacterium]
MMKVVNQHGSQTKAKLSSQEHMNQLLLATLPGSAVLSYAYGLGVVSNLLIAVFSCLAFDALMLRLRQKSVMEGLKDYSALVTAVLLGLALPPALHFSLVVLASFFAIVVAKQLYGGLGQNPFNPAMVGYVVLLISFPSAMSTWVAPDHYYAVLEPAFLGMEWLDGMTGSTLLDQSKLASLQPDIYTLPDVYWLNPPPMVWANIAFAMGGLYLLWRGVIRWHLPFCFLLSLALISALFYLMDSTRFSSPLFHLLVGASMMGAFFIITDPVSGATSRKGQCVFAVGVAVLVFVLREWSNYPEGLAFAVLLMNMLVPIIDHYTVPKTANERLL